MFLMLFILMIAEFEIKMNTQRVGLDADPERDDKK